MNSENDTGTDKGNTLTPEELKAEREPGNVTAMFDNCKVMTGKPIPTSEYLAQVRARCDAATPGLWSADGRDVRYSGGTITVFTWASRVEQISNAELIAHARTDLSCLLGEVERLRKQLDEVVCKRIGEMSEIELRALCLIEGTTLEKEAAHTKYVIRTAIREFEGKAERDTLRERVTELEDKLKEHKSEWDMVLVLRDYLWQEYGRVVYQEIDGESPGPIEFVIDRMNEWRERAEKAEAWRDTAIQSALVQGFRFWGDGELGQIVCRTKEESDVVAEQRKRVLQKFIEPRPMSEAPKGVWILGVIRMRLREGAPGFDYATECQLISEPPDGWLPCSDPKEDGR